MKLHVLRLKQISCSLASISWLGLVKQLAGDQGCGTTRESDLSQEWFDGLSSLVRLSLGAYLDLLPNLEELAEIKCAVSISCLPAV